MIKHLKTLVPSVLVALLVATAANGAFWQWAKTSASNATADPTINWAEGMSPSSVNDSARAMMARAAEYRDDISGALTTGGTATAFTLATNQGLNAVPTDGQMIAFTPHATNGAAPTLTVDGGTTYAIQTSPGVAVTSGTLVLGTPYTAKFSLANSAWIMRDFYGSPFSVPIGGLVAYTGTTAPNSGFVMPYGQCISRTTYAAYFAQVSTTFGACDGVTTFAVPDLRGRVIAALDNLGGSAAGRLTAPVMTPNGQVMGGVGGTQTHALVTAELPSHSHTVTATHRHDVYASNVGVTGGPSQIPVVSNTSGDANKVTSYVSSGTTDNTGSGTAHLNVQPTMVLSYILRVL